MRDRPVKLLLLQESDESGFTAFLDYPNGVRVEVTSPTFRKMVNTLRSFGLNTGQLFEDQVPKGMGFLERALR